MCHICRGQRRGRGLIIGCRVLIKGSDGAQQEVVSECERACSL